MEILCFMREKTKESIAKLLKAAVHIAYGRFTKDMIAGNEKKKDDIKGTVFNKLTPPKVALQKLSKGEYVSKKCIAIASNQLDKAVEVLRDYWREEDAPTV